jgi:hypothetical protein
MFQKCYFVLLYDLKITTISLVQTVVNRTNNKKLYPLRVVSYSLSEMDFPNFKIELDSNHYRALHLLDLKVYYFSKLL